MYRDSLDIDLLELMVGGLVGCGTARQFMAFHEISAQLPDAARLLLEPDGFEAPEEIDQRHALCAALVYHLWRGPDDELDRRIEGFLRRSEEHTSELQSRGHLVCRLLLEKKKK